MRRLLRLTLTIAVWLIAVSAVASMQVAQPSVLSSQSDLKKLQKRLKQEIRALTGASADAGIGKPSVSVVVEAARSGYRLQTALLERRGATPVTVSLAVPNGASAPRSATLLLDSRPVEVTVAPGEYVDLLANEGSIVMLIGNRAEGSGGTAIDDARAALAWLRAQRFVNRDVTLHGVGSRGLTALRTAVLDDRYNRLVVEDVSVSSDFSELIMATFAKPVAIVNPLSEAGTRMSPDSFAAAFSHVTASEANLTSGRFKMLRIATLFSPRYQDEARRQ